MLFCFLINSRRYITSNKERRKTQVTYILLKSIGTTLGKEGDSVTTYVIVNLSPEAR